MSTNSAAVAEYWNSSSQIKFKKNWSDQISRDIDSCSEEILPLMNIMIMFAYGLLDIPDVSVVVFDRFEFAC